MTLAKSASSWITAKRLRTHGFLLALASGLFMHGTWQHPACAIAPATSKAPTFFISTLWVRSLSLTAARIYITCQCNQNLRRSASSRRRGHPLSAAVSPTGFNFLRALRAIALSLGASLWLTLSAIGLRFMLLCLVARLPRSAATTQSTVS
jgi:hypothetical protein